MTQTQQYKPNKSLEDILKELSAVDSVTSLQEDYNKHKFKPGYDTSQGLASMGSIVANDPNTFVHNTDPSINFMANQYAGAKLQENETDAKHYAPKIISNYVSELNTILANATLGIQEKVKQANPKATEQEVDEAVKLNLYELVGSIMRKMPYSQEALKSNPHLAKAIGALENIEDLSEKGDYSSLVQSAVKDRGLPSSFAYSNAAINWARDLAHNNGYQRVIGKSFVKYSEGKYTIDQKAIESYTKDNVLAYAKMTNQSTSFKAQREAQEQAKKKK